MANTNLTIDMITNQALMILHQKLNFIGSVNRQYDASFAKSGAKIGDTLRVRLPNEYTVRSGATLSAQDTTETSVALPVTNQKGVDVNFSSEELTMDIDSFSERILEPAMSVLAANIEHDMSCSILAASTDIAGSRIRSEKLSMSIVNSSDEKLTSTPFWFVTGRATLVSVVSCAESVAPERTVYSFGKRTRRVSPILAPDFAKLASY